MTRVRNVTLKEELVKFATGNMFIVHFGVNLLKRCLSFCSSGNFNEICFIGERPYFRIVEIIDMFVNDIHRSIELNNTRCFNILLLN